MTSVRCEWLWQAEALEDGRLDDEERVAFEQHAAVCPFCSAEVTQLAALRRIVRALPYPHVDDVALRRSRSQLLYGAHARLAERRQARRWRVPVGIAMFTAAAGAVVLLARGAHVPSPAAPSTAVIEQPKFDVSGTDGSTWAARASGGTARVRLSTGAVTVHVEHLGAGQRFLVDLPDGELEVRGTRFRVVVTDDHTSHVEVTEGRVALRLRGRGERLLGAGQSWQPAPSPSTAPVEQRDLGAPVRARASHAHAHVTTRKAEAARGDPAAVRSAPVAPALEPRAGVSPPAVAASPALAPQEEPGDLFAAAVHAFEARDYADADRLFVRFALARPRDARAEDALFLRAVARARVGDRQGAAALAREYLRRYPHGLRRLEAERFAGP